MKIDKPLLFSIKEFKKGKKYQIYDYNHLIKIMKILMRHNYVSISYTTDYIKKNKKSIFAFPLYIKQDKDTSNKFKFTRIYEN